LVNRLTTLYALQLIDEQLDVLEELRGDLPLAVNNLISRIQGIKDQIDEKEEEKKNSLKQRKDNDEEVERLGVNLKRFKSQLYSVRNNKEYDALTKEIDHTESEIERLDLESIELEDYVEKLKIEIKELSPDLDELKSELKEKETDLKKIIKENEKEEVKLKAKREKIAELVKKNDYNTYMRIRKALNGSAVVTVVRSACSGCHNIVPSQRQIEIRQNKRLFTCESCGRLLISNNIAEESAKL